MSIASRIAIAVLIAAAAPVRAAVIEFSESTIAAGEMGQVSVRLRTGGAEVVATQNDIQFPSGIQALAANDPPWPRSSGTYACRVNPEIRKELAFNFLSGASDSGGEWMRAIVLSIANLGPIADGAMLYTCDVFVLPTTQPGRYPVRGFALAAADAGGHSIPMQSRDGAIHVVAGANSSWPTHGRPGSGFSREPGARRDPGAPLQAARRRMPTLEQGSDATRLPGEHRRPATPPPTATVTPAADESTDAIFHLIPFAIWE